MVGKVALSCGLGQCNMQPLDDSAASKTVSVLSVTRLWCTAVVSERAISAHSPVRNSSAWYGLDSVGVLHQS